MTDQTYTSALPPQMRPAIQLAIKQGDPSIAKELTDFIRDILFMAVRYMDRRLYEAYLDLPEYLYNTINERRDDGETMTTLFAPYRFEVPSGILRDLLGTAMYNLGSDLEETVTDIDGRYFYNRAFVKFNSFIKASIIRNDQSAFIMLKSNFDIAYRTAMFYKGHAERSHKEEMESDKENAIPEPKVRAIDLVHQDIEAYYRRSLLGLRYWTNYLFYRGVLNENSLQFFMEKIRLIAGNSKDLINDLLFVTSGEKENYMDWSTWAVPIKDGQNAVDDAPSRWMLIGYMIDILTKGGFFLNIEEQDTENIEKLLVLADRLEELGNELLQQHERWHQLLNVQSRSGLKQRIIQALSPLTRLRPFEFPEFQEDIVRSSLSDERINAFKERAGQAWQKQSRMRALFELYDNTMEIPANGKKLVRTGKRNLLINAKSGFVDDERTIPIYGTEDLAAIVGRTEDELLFDRISNSSPSVVKGSNIPHLLDQAIAQLDKRQIKANVILTHPEFSYKDDTLLESKKFKGHMNLINDGQRFPAWHIGDYNDLPIYTAFSEFLIDRFVVCDFQKAFTLEYKSDEEWYARLLNLDIRELNREEIMERMADKTKDWGPAEDGSRRTPEQVYKLLSSSVIFDAWTLLDFNIKDPNALVVAKLEEASQDDI